jgi:hypothetical protein
MPGYSGFGWSSLSLCGGLLLPFQQPGNHHAKRQDEHPHCDVQGIAPLREFSGTPPSHQRQAVPARPLAPGHQRDLTK